MDTFLEKYITRYDKWIKEDAISHSSRVVPVNESLEGIRHIIPSNQATEILKEARTITLAECICRKRYQNCDRPLEVCFVLNESGEAWMNKRQSRKVSYSEALEVIKQTNLSGLVHLTLYKPDHEIFALCSCCSCCCHDLQLVMKYSKDYIITKSDYMAQDDRDICMHCGKCIDRCEFKARQFDDDIMVYDPELCYGCGLCVTTCSENAIELVKKR